jgi:hypothetical protein
MLIVIKSNEFELNYIKYNNKIGEKLATTAN